MKKSIRRSCTSAAIVAAAAALTVGLTGVGAGADPVGDQQQEQQLAEMITT